MTQKQIEIKQRHDAILRFAEEQKPVTVRGVYYHLTTLDLVPKTQAGYQKVARDCKALRLESKMPWSWIADNTRWSRKWRTETNMELALRNTATAYRRDFMQHQNLQIEVWLEKDALSGVFFDITSNYDIPLMVSRGFSSLTFLHSAAEAFADCDMQNEGQIFIFTDFDAAGMTIEVKIREAMAQFAPGAVINIERVGLTKSQVDSLNLPTRSPKATDIKQGFDYCCELDAVPPNTLREWVDTAILSRVDRGQLEQLRNIERAERESLILYARNFDSNFDHSSV